MEDFLETMAEFIELETELEIIDAAQEIAEEKGEL